MRSLPSGGELLFRPRLLQEGAVHAVEIETAHHRGFPDDTHAGRALLVGRGVLFDDLEALLAMFHIGQDVDREEGDLVFAEAVLLEQRRRGLAVDARHLALQADQQARQRLDEGLARLHRAPALQAERFGQQLAVQLRVQHRLARHAAGLAELQQQVRVTHRRRAAHADQTFFFGHVLEQEVLHVLVRAVGVDRRDPLREVTDIMVVLLHPLAEQAAVERARRPGLAPRMHGRMPLLDGVLEGETECTLCHGSLLWIVYNQTRFDQLSPFYKPYCIQIAMKSEDYAQGDAFQAEKRSIFSTEWLPACAEAQIPKAGDFFSLTVGGWSVVVTRDAAGAVTVLRNMCRHQNMPVVGAPAGNCENFRCRFHGWTYDLKGKFLGAPPPVAPKEPSANHDMIVLPMLIEAGIVFFSLDSF